jgi:hypothetical protein
MNMTHRTVMMLRKTLLIGVFPPVEAFTLLLPYPPKAGRAMNRPPVIFATPRATSSRLALRFIFLITELADSPTPKLLAATEDSKKPSNAIMKLVLKASEAYLSCDFSRGQCTGNGLLPVLMSPRISTPSWSHLNCQLKMAERTTMTKRSGM